MPETPKLTVDIIIETAPDTIVLIKRKNPPDGWALPGGFVDIGETVKNAAWREAKEETGLDITGIQFFSIQDDPSRDPRGHTVSIVFTAKANGKPVGADDAARADIFSYTSLPDEIAFDHQEIIENYFTALMGKTDK